MLRTPRRVAAIATISDAALPVVGLAVAHWTTSGTGSGVANTGRALGVIVNQTASPTELYPGGSVALSGNFDNPNRGPVYITAVTASVSPFSVQPDIMKPACTQADFAVSGTATVGGEVAAGNGVSAWSGLSLSMIDAVANQDNCKNSTIPIAYAAT